MEDGFVIWEQRYEDFILLSSSPALRESLDIAGLREELLRSTLRALWDPALTSTERQAVAAALQQLSCEDCGERKPTPELPSPDLSSPDLRATCASLAEPSTGASSARPPSTPVPLPLPPAP